MASRKAPLSADLKAWHRARSAAVLPVIVRGACLSTSVRTLAAFASFFSLDKWGTKRDSVVVVVWVGGLFGDPGGCEAGGDGKSRPRQRDSTESTSALLKPAVIDGRAACGDAYPKSSSSQVSTESENLARFWADPDSEVFLFKAERGGFFVLS